jgi:peptidoglycan hydrolase CwlO-like protein
VNYLVNITSINHSFYFCLMYVLPLIIMMSFFHRSADHNAGPSGTDNIPITDNNVLTNDMKLDILCKGQEEMMKALQSLTGQVSSLTGQFNEINGALNVANAKIKPLRAQIKIFAIKLIT